MSLDAVPGGLPFWKMSGSGNDFVFFDARHGTPESLRAPEAVQAICARGTGIGADGVVFLEPGESRDEAFRITYLNSDGSRASLCGNASLCSVRLASELGAVGPGEFSFGTDAGVLGARMHGGEPEIDLQPVREVRPDAGIDRQPGERRIGFALAGVPHLVILVDELDRMDVVGRGRPLRSDPAVMPAGANVNFVARACDGWDIRTYERGVEGETLACGTGAVATAVLLTAWGEARGEVALRTRSGRVLTVRLEREGASWRPSLSGEGRIVFRGVTGEL